MWLGILKAYPVSFDVPMITLDSQRVEQALPKIQPGLEKYCWLQENLYKFDVSASREFQKKYNGFYRVRRGAVWQSSYYELLENAKISEITFEKALSLIFTATGKLEVSFASKLVATIDPNLPVIDRFVLVNVGLTLPCYGEVDRRKKKAVEVYEQLIIKFNDFSKTKEGKILMTRFQEVYPHSYITKTKMIDLVLWQTR